MNLTNDFTVTKLADEYVAVPMNNMERFNGVIKLNESGAEIFQGLIEGQEEQQLVKRLMEKYPELDLKTAEDAVAQVLNDLKNAKVLEA